MFAKIHLWVRRFLHVSVGRPQCFFLGKGDVDVCAFFFILILILPSCSSLKFFSFNFSAATHILIGTLCLRRDSGIGVSTQFNSFCCGFGVCCVSFVAGGDGRNVCKRWQQSLFSSFPSFFLFFSYSFFFFPVILKGGHLPLCFFHPVASQLEQELWLCWLNCWKASHKPSLGLSWKQ